MSSKCSLFPGCRIHGKPTKRQSCKECNAAYMRAYLRRRRRERPEQFMWERARKRAAQRGIAFSLPKASILIPRTCPVLGQPIVLRDRRSSSSPSLDRIVPARGYVRGNVRVISDRANRLKGRRSLAEIKALAENGPAAFRDDYRMIATYLEREQLLSEVRDKARVGGRAGAEWTKIADFLDRIFQRSLLGSGN